MNTFLARLAEQLYTLPPGDTLVIVPTRRAASELRLGIAEKISGPSRLPAIIAIRDLLDQLSPYPIPADEVLLLELYETYKNEQPGERFSQFLSWGEQLLKDFNELDLHAAPAEILFERLADLKEIDLAFSQDEEDLEHLRSFWKQFTVSDLSPLRKEFIGYWKMLPSLYHAYRDHLTQKEIAYEGMAWRMISNSKEIPAFFKSFKTIVYAGFYAFTKTEELLIENLRMNFDVRLFKDADRWYAEPKFREAGMFFRKGLLKDESTAWTDQYLEKIPHHFEVIGTGGKNAMARELAGRLYNYLAEHSVNPGRVVVVLPDDSILFSFLNYCRSFAIPVNPSMGFPLTQHPAWQAIELLKLIRIQLTQAAVDDSAHYANLLLADSPLLKTAMKNEADFLKSLAEGKAVNHTGLFKNLLDKNYSDEFLIMDGFLQRLVTTDADDEYSGLIHVLRNEAKNISVILNRYPGVLSTENWWKLVVAHLQRVRIPFASDRENGVHVMGFLETRMLDFEAVFIASMNEGMLPVKQVSRSLIPYPVRKYYQMPCREEQEAVTAYHFYRLIQRSPYVCFLYDSNPDQLGGGEVSRYLLQVQHELVPGSIHTIKFEQVAVKPPATASRTISLQKSTQVLEALINKYTGDNAKTFSASALQTYISCPLKFYLIYIAGIKAPEEEVPTLEANRFGEALHKTMQLLYQKDTTYTIESLHELLKITDEKTDEAIQKTFKKGPLKGIDLLMAGVLKKLAKQIISNDVQDAPFTITGLEEEYQIELDINKVGKVKLRGVLDRIDEINGRTRIIDYKTGVEKVKWPKIPELVFTDPEYKVTFQLLIYLLLVNAGSSGKPVLAGIYHLSSANEIEYLDDKHKDPLGELNFEDGLKNLISEIFNPAIPFSQTPEIKNCLYCDYTGLCRRVN